MKIKRVHIVAVCGTLMGAFACFLKRSGIEVTGSDQNVYPPMSDVLKKAGVTLFNGFSASTPELLPERPDLVVIGNAVRSDNPEARAFIDGGYDYCSLPEFMERHLLTETRNIVVSGTHGKTTTSTLLSYVLDQCGEEPSYFFGGVSPNLPHSFHVSSRQGGCFVLEGDEYDTAFWDKVPKFYHYLPNDVILTSVEFDHADIYPDFEAVKKVFRKLVGNVRSGGRLIACVDYPEISKMIQDAKVPVLTYGSHAGTGARYVPGDVRVTSEFATFSVLDNGEKVDEVTIQLFGMHNFLNALSVWIECKELGLSMDRVKAAMKSFKGVVRRQQVRADVAGVKIIDDFAHHPTAIRETLKAFRQKYPDQRLVVVFEPRSATSRRNVFQTEFADALAHADAVFLSKPYDQTRIPENERLSSEKMIRDIQKKSGSPDAGHLMETVDQGVSQIAAFVKKGDVVAVLSNGGFEGLIDKLTKALQAKA